MTVDGYWGRDTTRALQARFGLLDTGNVYHQYRPNVDANPALTSGWYCDDTLIGDALIRRLQSYVGADADGVLGTSTVKALQRMMGTLADGVLDADSACVREMQVRLLNGTF